MTRFLVLSLLMFLISCDGEPAGPPHLDCEIWASCVGALTIHTDLVENAFRRQRADVYVPGDSILVRIRMQNRATVPTDSLQIVYEGNGFAPWSSVEVGYDSLGSWIEPVVLGAGETREVIDTFVVGGFTFDDPTRLEFNVLRWDNSSPVDARISGVRDFPIARSGYKFEIVSGLPGPTETIHYFNKTYTGTRVRHNTDTGVLVRISNPYQMPLAPLPIGHCFWDDDHCYVREFGPSSVALDPGREAYVAYVFNFDTQGHYHEWWSKDYTQLGVCAEDGFSPRCGFDYIDVIVTANFEADCTVATVPVGVETRDDTPDCGPRKSGSAYRFDAKEGERYKVTLLDGVGEIFLSTSDGVVQGDPKPQELLISQSGLHYVAILHGSPVRFRLERLN